MRVWGEIRKKGLNKKSIERNTSFPLHVWKGKIPWTSMKRG